MRKGAKKREDRGIPAEGLEGGGGKREVKTEKNLKERTGEREIQTKLAFSEIWRK